jgi:hypothetical protein
MKDLAQAISALINSAPRSPRVEEIEAVIRQHMPEAPNREITRIAPAAFPDALRLLVRRSSPPFSKTIAAELAGQLTLGGALPVPSDAIILYAVPWLLIDPRDDRRTVAGHLVRPPRIYLCWYDEEQDCIDARPMSPWDAVRAAAPDVYDQLMKAWQLVRNANP